jgi:hypothetical protein
MIVFAALVAWFGARINRGTDETLQAIHEIIQAIGIDLLAIDPKLIDLQKGRVDYVTTPIKHRIEDGKLFKFLSILDGKKQIIEVALSLDSLLNF